MQTDMGRAKELTSNTKQENKPMNSQKLFIPASSVKQFYAMPKIPTLRLGQAFYDHFKLWKHHDREFTNRLYQADGKEAKELIEQITDFTQ